MQNLSLQIKCSFSKINSTFFFPALFYPTLISTLLKAASKNFKRMLLEHRFDGFFRFLNLFFKALLLNWFKNLRVQIGLYQKRAGVLTSWRSGGSKSNIEKKRVNLESDSQFGKYLLAALLEGFHLLAVIMDDK